MSLLSRVASQTAAWPRYTFVVVYLVITLSLAHGSLYLQGLVLTAALFAVLAIGLDLVACTGLYTLAQGGLFAVGSYTTAVLWQEYSLNIWLLLPIATLTAAVAGLVIGALSLKVSGLYFTISTFIFTLLANAAVSILGITGGYNGLAPPPFPLAFPNLQGLGAPLVWVGMLILLVAIVVAWSIRRSPLYSIMLTIRDSEALAASVGARTALIKVGLFGLSAGLAGLAGWGFAFLGYVSPSQFGWSVSVNVLVAVILGGINTLAGPLLGAAFVSAFPAYVNLNGITEEMVLGLIFIVVIVLFPAGFMGLVRGLAARLRPGALARAPRSPAPAGPGGPTRGPEPAPLYSRPAGRAGPRPADGHAVSCTDIVFRYPTSRVPALSEVSFAADWGVIHGLIGPNGSGKSTLVDVLSGRSRPLAGEVRVGGQVLTNAGAPQRARHGLIRTFQTAHLVSELSSRDNVRSGLYYRVPRISLRAPVWPLLPGANREMAAMNQRAGTALGYVGARQWEHQRISEVSHGVEQLTQIALACISEPSVVILDEPLAGLTMAEAERVREVLVQLREAGVCVILIEHQVNFVFSVCDQVTVLSAGRTVTSGPAAEVRADTRVREIYLGQR